jgi:hypothetical protein
MQAVMWKRDVTIADQERLTTSIVMHRRAGVLGYSCLPQASNIDRGRYFAEINRIVTNADGSYSHTIPNVAMGTGDTPLEAAADGYAAVLPEMIPYRALSSLEAILPRLQRRAAAHRKLDQTLAVLTDALRSANVPRAADPGEDDEL